MEPLTWVVVTTINRLRILLFLAETGPRVRSIPHLKIAYMGLLRAYVCRPTLAYFNSPQHHSQPT